MADETADRMANTAEKGADDLRQQMRDLRRETERQLDRMAEQMKHYGSDMARDTKSHIRHRPLTSVGGAFAAGMVVGCLLASLGGMSRH